jgi:hypothetical protein
VGVEVAVEAGIVADFGIGVELGIVAELGIVVEVGIVAEVETAEAEVVVFVYSIPQTVFHCYHGRYLI